MLTLNYIDFCYPDYLSDHHNRENEQLIVLSPGNYQLIDMIDAIMEDLNNFDVKIFEHFSSEEIVKAIQESGIEISDSEDVCEELSECCHYLFFEW